MSNRDLPPTYRLFRAIWIVLFVLVACALVTGMAMLLGGNLGSVRPG